jgi:hypothetical protein
MEHTFALSVVSPIMAPFSAHPKPDWPVVTPLHVNHICSALEEAGVVDKFLDVPDGLTNGFPFNSSIIVDSTHISPN